MHIRQQNFTAPLFHPQKSVQRLHSNDLVDGTQQWHAPVHTHHVQSKDYGLLYKHVRRHNKP
jgi:hypothetical protein